MKCRVSAFHTEIESNFITLQIPLKEEIGGEREGEERVTLPITLISPKKKI
jgi:hypothetical protein